MSIELSIETADRVLSRVHNGVVTFRAMNATEEQHVLRALHYWREIGHGVPELLAEIESLRAYKAAAEARATEGLNIA